MKTFFQILPWILSAVLAVLLYISWDMLRDKTTASEAMKSVLTVEIEQATRRIAQREATIELLQFKMDSAGQSHLISQGGLKTQIKRLKSKVGQLASVSMLSNAKQDSVSVLDGLVLRDSVITLQDSLISDLEVDRDGIKRDCKVLTDSLIAQTMDYKFALAKTDTLKQFAEKDLKKEVKAKKWWRRIAAAGGVVIVWLAVKPE